MSQAFSAPFTCMLCTMRETAAAYPGDLPGLSPRLRAALRERPPPAVELGFMRYGALKAAAELALVVKDENGALRIPFPAVSAIACEKTDRSRVALRDVTANFQPTAFWLV